MNQHLDAAPAPTGAVLAPTPPRRTDRFVGIDSDGCVFDTMGIKHRECFIPAIIRFWGLQPVATAAREVAEFVNLASTSRGQNRWIALVRTFDLLPGHPDVVAAGFEVPRAQALRDFVASGLPLSDAGLARYAAAHPDPVLERAAAWTAAVNVAVRETVVGVPPVRHVRECLRRLRPHADLVVVSATPAEALAREWGEHGLTGLVDLVGGQELGTKAQQLRTLAGTDRPDGHVLLIGDAPGDRDAAFSEGALYLPVEPGNEARSWERFLDEGIDRYLDGTFAGQYQRGLVADFEALLPSTPPWAPEQAPDQTPEDVR